MPLKQPQSDGVASSLGKEGLQMLFTALQTLGKKWRNGLTRAMHKQNPPYHPVPRETRMFLPAPGTSCSRIPCPLSQLTYTDWPSISWIVFHSASCNCQPEMWSLATRTEVMGVTQALG